MPYAPSLSGPLTWEPTPQRELSDKYALSLTALLCWACYRTVCVFAFQFFALNSPDSHDYVQPVCLLSIRSNGYTAGKSKSLSYNKVRLVLGDAQAVLQPTSLVQDVTSVSISVWIKIVEICGLYATSCSALSLYTLLVSFFIVLADNSIL